MGWWKSLGPDHKPGDWTPTARGNLSRIEYGAWLVVFETGTGWRWSCRRPWLRKTPLVFGPRTYRTCEAAQQAAIESNREYEERMAPVRERNRAYRERRQERLRAERDRLREEWDGGAC